MLLEDWLDDGSPFACCSITFLLLITLIERVVELCGLHLFLLVALIKDVVGFRCN